VLLLVPCEMSTAARSASVGSVPLHQHPYRRTGLRFSDTDASISPPVKKLVEAFGARWRVNRSACGLQSGLRGGTLATVMPSLAKTASNAAVNFASRSRMRWVNSVRACRGPRDPADEDARQVALPREAVCGRGLRGRKRGGQESSMTWKCGLPGKF
jgi:hypothetical protein